MLSHLFHAVGASRDSPKACGLDKELYTLANGLSANGTGLECRTALYAGGVSTLKHQLDVVVDADGAGDALLHLSVSRLQLLQKVVLLRVLCPGTAVHLCLILSDFLCNCDLTFDALLHSVGTLFTGHTVLTGAEEHQQSQFGADQTLAGPGGRGQHQVGHGVRSCVHSPQAGTAQALATCKSRQTLQPVLLREALYELHQGAVCDQIQGTLAFVVSVVDVCSFLGQITGESCSHTQLSVSQQA